jgi:hypothetical protein
VELLRLSLRGAAHALSSLGRCEETRAIVEPLIATAPRENLLPVPLSVLADCLRKRRVADAIPPLERALAICAAHGCDRTVSVYVRLSLGIALVESRGGGGGGGGVVVLGRAARAEAEGTPYVTELDAWLAKRR